MSIDLDALLQALLLVHVPYKQAISWSRIVHHKPSDAPTFHVRPWLVNDRCYAIIEALPIDPIARDDVSN